MTLIKGVLIAFGYVLRWSIAAALAAVGIAHLLERIASIFH